MKNNETIIIYRNGQKVIALDKRNGNTAEAKCSPEDEFDFVTGAKLALERLEEKPKFKVGDLVIGNNNADAYGVTRKGSVGKVVHVYSNGCIDVLFINSTLCHGAGYDHTPYHSFNYLAPERFDPINFDE